MGVYGSIFVGEKHYMLPFMLMLILRYCKSAARCSIFAFRRQVQQVNPPIFQHVILDLPGLAFFTTYALLALFWAEILYQARGLMTDQLRSGHAQGSKMEVMHGEDV